VFATTEQLQGSQPDSHAPSLAAKPSVGATHIKQQCKPLLVRGSIQCQLCSKPRAVYAAQSFSLCQKWQACTSVLQQSSLTLHATMTTSMFVDGSCFHQDTSWMRQYIATIA
jgi:hypothetical protein